jgi:hypothetical protein
MGAQILLVVIAVAVLWLNIKATISVFTDDLSEPIQRWLQLLIAWVLPLAGAIIVLAVHRSGEEPSRQYRKEQGEVDDLEDFDTGVTGVEDATSTD